MAAPLDKDNEAARARDQLVTPIVVTFLVSLFGFALLFVFFLGFGQGKVQDNTLKQTYPPPVAGLSVCGSHFDALFREEDYRKLRMKPELKSVCEAFRRDQRRIALMWLDELRRDVRILWEFRRFLVRDGLRVTFREEAGVVSAALLALIYVNAVRIAVSIVGPFVFVAGLKNARLVVERLSSLDIALLAHLPAPRKVEIEQRWARRLEALGVRAG